jgi:hypothetical protein
MIQTDTFFPITEFGLCMGSVLTVLLRITVSMSLRHKLTDHSNLNIRANIKIPNICQ